MSVLIVHNIADDLRVVVVLRGQVFRIQRYPYHPLAVVMRRYGLVEGIHFPVAEATSLLSALNEVCHFLTSDTCEKLKALNEVRVVLGAARIIVSGLHNCLVQVAYYGFTSCTPLVKIFLEAYFLKFPGAGIWVA